MPLCFRTFAACLAALLLGAASPVFAQGADAFGAGGSGNIDAQNGLESATPTDNVNELNSGGPVPPSEGGDTGDFPAADDSANFDIGNTGNNGGGGSGGNGVFNNAPVNIGNGAKGGANAPANNFGGAFGGNGPGANNAKAAANAAAPNGAPPATPVNAVPAVNANVPANVPANTPPANAEALLNQAQGANNAPAANTPANSAANAKANANGNPAQAATGNEALAPPPPPGPPPIQAPPLPPPNEFAGAPPVPGTMRLMAEGEAPEEYKVDPGDTLYDICDQLLDEAAYWPKLWALNPEIKNPHFIFPNMRLKFYPGDDETPPYLQVVTEDDVIPIDKGDLDEQELVAEKVIFPEKAALEEQLTEVIGPDQVDALQDEILTGGKRYAGGEIDVHVPGFIFGQEKEPLGYVIGGRSGEISLGPEAKAIVESTGGLSAGTLYTVLRPGEKVEDPETGDLIGYKYYFVANLKIDKSLGEDAFIGVVQDTRLSVLPNDIIVNYISTKRSIPSTTAVGSLSSSDAYVVGFEYAGQEIGGQGHFAFIGKGNGDGVSPGMYLPIYATPGYLTTAFGSADLPVDYEFIGVIRIIDTTDAGAVGYVVKNTKELRIGDRTNKG